MTNEEKIEEIVIDAFEGWSKVGFAYDEIITILSKLAKWKDQQFKEYLEKKSQKLIFSDNWADGLKLQFLGEIINGLFGGE